MIAVLGLVVGIVLGLVLRPAGPVSLDPYLPIAGQLSTGVIVVLGIRIFSNVAAIRRHIFHA